MKKYRKTIKQRIILLSIVVVIMVIVGAMDSFGVIKHILGDMYNENVVSFQTGLLIGIGILALYLVVRYTQCIRNEDKLRILYNNEFDERKKYMKSKAGMPIIGITSGCIIFAGIIAGYFSEIIFITLIAVAMFQMTVCAIVKIIYMKTM